MQQNATQSAGEHAAPACGEPHHPKESTLRAILQFAATYRPVVLADGTTIQHMTH